MKNRQQGASLIEAIIGFGLLGLVVTGTTKFMSQNTTSTKRVQYRAARDQLAYMIAEAIQNPENIALSAVKGQFNNQLRNCIRNNRNPGTGVCNAIGINNARPFSLHVKSNNESGNVIVGTPNRDDVHYNWSGEKAERGGVKEDMMHPTVYFWGDCGINPRTGNINRSCNKAANIYVGFVIRPSQGPYSANYAGNEARAKFVPPYPKGAVRINGDVRVSDLYMTAAVTPAFAVSSRMDAICPFNRYLSGYDSQGKAVCECFQRNCANNKCRNDEVLVGWTDIPGTKYKRPKCRSLTRTSDFKCQNRGSSTCPSGYWLAQFRTGGSYGRFCHGSAEFQKGKGGWSAKSSWNIQCQSERRQNWRCCTLKGGYDR